VNSLTATSLTTAASLFHPILSHHLHLHLPSASPSPSHSASHHTTPCPPLLSPPNSLHTSPCQTNDVHHFRDPLPSSANPANRHLGLRITQPPLTWRAVTSSSTLRKNQSTRVYRQLDHPKYFSHHSLHLLTSSSPHDETARCTTEPPSRPRSNLALAHSYLECFHHV
jgi:hypothetical protein